MYLGGDYFTDATVTPSLSPNRSQGHTPKKTDSPNNDASPKLLKSPTFSPGNKTPDEQRKEMHKALDERVERSVITI